MARHKVSKLGKNVIMPSVYRLPFGAVVRIEYVDDLGENHGEWHGFNAAGEGLIRIEKRAPEEMLDTLYHEMIHCIPDFHAHFIRPMQRAIIRAMVEEAAAQAAEEAE
jgi:hypothetical protein